MAIQIFTHPQAVMANPTPLIQPVPNSINVWQILVEDAETGYYEIDGAYYFAILGPDPDPAYRQLVGQWGYDSRPPSSWCTAMSSTRPVRKPMSNKFAQGTSLRYWSINDPMPVSVPRCTDGEKAATAYLISGTQAVTIVNLLTSLIPGTSLPPGTTIIDVDGVFNKASSVDLKKNAYSETCVKCGKPNKQLDIGHRYLYYCPDCEK